ADEIRFRVSSRPVRGEIEIAVGAGTGMRKEGSAPASPFTDPPPHAAVSSPTGVDYNSFGPEQRLQLVLVDELARNLGGRLETRSDSGPWKWLCIVLDEARSLSEK